MPQLLLFSSRASVAATFPDECQRAHEIRHRPVTVEPQCATVGRAGRALAAIDAKKRKRGGESEDSEDSERVEDDIERALREAVNGDLFAGWD